MLPEHKKTLKSLVLTLRHLFEGHYDESGAWHPGDLERRLNALGVFADREVPLHDMGQLPASDRRARDVADAYIALRDSAGIARESAVREYVRESAHTWANRLLALRMMEARGLIDEVVLARADYGNRSLEHRRALQADPFLRTHEDEGLASVLESVFTRMSDRLPNLFEPASPATALRPSTTALKKAIALLSGTEAPRGQQPATADVFTAADALGWAYQYWNTEEKDRVFEAVRTKKSKISGDDIIPATQLYTEPYMVKFLVQNSLGATWMCMHPNSKLAESWDYYVWDADREPMDPKAVAELAFLDPACGSGHFLLEAFDMLFDFYEEEGERDASTIATSILERNLFGIDIDERAVQIAEAALWMRASERVLGFTGLPANLIATNIRLPEEKAGVDAYLEKYPEDAPLRSALEAVLSSLQHADELGSLLKLEEPIEDELKSLERGFERSSAKGTQASLFGEMPVQAQLPVGVSSYDEWKRKVVGRLAEHFHDEAVSADAGAAWFGRSAAKGLKLFELLSRRYDVVAANPPYMGSRTMGPVLARYLELHYASGKSDLYAAMILRSRELTNRGGRFALVTQHAWLFLQSFGRLRAGTDDSLLTSARYEVLAHLGTGSFAEITGEVVNTVLSVLSNSSPRPDHSILGIRVVGAPSITSKTEMLRSASRSTDSPNVYIKRQSAFLGLVGTPLVYWLTDTMLTALGSEDRIGAGDNPVASMHIGLCTGDNSRFVRFHWEVRSTSREWRWCARAGSYSKWFGLQTMKARWSGGGFEYSETSGARVQNVDMFFSPGVTYNLIAAGSMNARLLGGDEMFEQASVAVLPKTGHGAEEILAVLNTRLASFLLRAVTQDLKFNPGYVGLLPVGCVSDCAVDAVSFAVKLKRLLAACDPVERSFLPRGTSADTRAVAACLLVAEAQVEKLSPDSFGLPHSDLEFALAETGAPAGFHPLIAGYDDLGILEQTPVARLASLAGQPETVPLLSLSPEELSSARARLRSLFEHASAVDDTPDSDEAVSGGYIPIPAETSVERLSQALEIHPISVYWMLKEGIENEGWSCIPEEQKGLTDKVSVLVLRALGHRWPKQTEAGDPVASYADPDGVIPISEGTDESALIERLRDVIEEETGVAAPTFEAHFADVMGISLETWLATKFFAHHIKQFKKRPIAWHLVSSKPTARRRPAFSALVYYHALDGDLIPKIRSHYLSPLRSRAETELRGIEATPEAGRSGGQVSRRAELDERIAELKDLDERLKSIELEGFESSELTKLIANESVDTFCSVDGIKPKPVDTEAFGAQERAYLPDLNDGVRVNISPWQKAGVLAADVLATKDLDKAIADRARWRSAERRWCREGKLPRPGWWPEG